MPKNRVKVEIMKAEYFILSEDPEEYVIETAKETEQKILSIIKTNEKISTTMAATLVAMDYCDEAKKANKDADNLRFQIKDYLDDSSKSRIKVEEYKQEIERLKNEIGRLRMRLSEKESIDKIGTRRISNSNNEELPSPPISQSVNSKKDVSSLSEKPVRRNRGQVDYNKMSDELMDFFDNED